MLRTMSSNTVKWTVAQILDQRNMTTQEFADRAGIAFQTALNLRRGSITRVDIQTLEKVCSALGVQVGDLLIYSS